VPSKKSSPERGGAQPRLRVLAGPNGSGKTTILRELRPEWIGAFVNADEIERELRDSGGTLNLAEQGISGRPSAVLRRMEKLIRESEFARKLGMHALLGRMSIDRSLRLHVPEPHNSYVASVIADAIRWELLHEGQTFTFESVMSSGDKIEFMKEARKRGYRVYLYFVATEDPRINVDRVRRRVKLGGHPVPAKKIRSRYVRSIALMSDACDVAHRAYIFDNSGQQHKLLVEIDDGHEMTVETGELPRWFTDTALWQSFQR